MWQTSTSSACSASWERRQRLVAAHVDKLVGITAARPRELVFESHARAVELDFREPLHPASTRAHDSRPSGRLGQAGSGTVCPTSA